MPHTTITYPYIVADIGGTNSRFALVTSADRTNNNFVIEKQKTFPSANFETIEQAITQYISTLEGQTIKSACLAVAGPVAGDQIQLTNLDWQFSIKAVEKRLNFDNLIIMNDFAAYAYALQYLDKHFFRTIKIGQAIAGSPIAVMGPGTGFGVATLIQQGNRVNALALEGGHMSLAANTAQQMAIKEFMSRRFKLVSIECVFSGPGLRYLYQALAAVEGTAVRKISTSEICQFALQNTDEMCLRTLTLFCSWLGAVAGDLALALGAKGGIYLGGGILPRITDFLIASDFESSFKAKHQMSHYLEDIPIQLVTEGNSALLGAAAWLENCVCD